jgi:hypothetical protein
MLFNAVHKSRLFESAAGELPSPPQTLCRSPDNFLAHPPKKPYNALKWVSDADFMKNAVCVLLVLLLAGPARADVLYVHPPADYTNEIKTGRLKGSIQGAIDAASNGDTIVVEEGTYFENINFRGKNIVLTSTDPNDPNVVATTVIDGNNLESAVTFAGTEDETCVLSGFTIRNGFDCNYVSRKGGGISGGSRWNHTRATIRNNTITRNHSEGGGGGISYCDGLIEKNTITGNTSHYWQGGGGLYFCNGLIRNNLITGNKGFGCEGVAGLKACCGIVQNCTISGNEDGIWGGVDYCPTISNCIIWGNSPPQMSDLAAPSYSCIQDWNGTGAGNTSADPCFVSPGYWDSNGVWIDGDYHLKSQAGRWEPSEGRWTIDEVTSPCIDAGDPLSPIMYEPFPNGGRINMGAYGGTAEASKSYFGKPPCEIIVAGDINGDCAVNFLDFRLMALHWLTNGNL